MSGVDEIQVTEDAKINTVYYSRNGVLKQDVFKADATLGEMLDKYEQEDKDPKTSIKENYVMDGKPLNKTDRFIDLVNKEPNAALTGMDIEIEVDEEVPNDDENEEPMEKIIKPTKEPFGLIVFLPDKGIVLKERYPNETIEKYGLNEYNNEEFAYCDSPKTLFVSGPSKEENCGVLYKIDHDDYSISKIILPFIKSQHSMLFIPDKYLLFAGGNDLKTYLYDLTSNEVMEFGDMNEIHEKPALFQSGNNIFSLGTFDQSKPFFEKTDISDMENPIWEKVSPQALKEEDAVFDNVDYGVSKSNNGDILICGGTNTALETFLYNPESNFLSKTQGSDEALPLDDKTFYKFNDNYNIAIPSCFEEDPCLAVLNKKTKTLKRVNYNPTSPLKKTYKLKEFQDKPQSGNVALKAKYCELVDEEQPQEEEEEQEQEQEQEQEPSKEKLKNTLIYYSQRENGKQQ